MVVAHHWSQARAPTGAIAPDVDLGGSPVGGRRSPGMGLKAVQRTGASLRPGWGDGALAHRGCVLLEHLCCQVKEQQEKVNRMHRLRSVKNELNWIESKPDPEHPVVPKEGQAASSWEVASPLMVKAGTW